MDEVLAESELRLQSSLVSRGEALQILEEQPNHAYMTLSSATSITPEMAVIAGAMCLLMGRPPSWANAQDVLSSGRLPGMAALVEDTALTSKALHKVTNLVKTKELRRFVQDQGPDLAPPSAAFTLWTCPLKGGAGKKHVRTLKSIGPSCVTARRMQRLR